jgi:hypothetical protein
VNMQIKLSSATCPPEQVAYSFEEASVILTRAALGSAHFPLEEASVILTRATLDSAHFLLEECQFPILVSAVCHSYLSRNSAMTGARMYRRSMV